MVVFCETHEGQPLAIAAIQNLGWSYTVVSDQLVRTAGYKLDAGPFSREQILEDKTATERAVEAVRQAEAEGSLKRGTATERAVEALRQAEAGASLKRGVDVIDVDVDEELERGPRAERKLIKTGGYGKAPRKVPQKNGDTLVEEMSAAELKANRLNADALERERKKAAFQNSQKEERERRLQGAGLFAPAEFTSTTMEDESGRTIRATNKFWNLNQFTGADMYPGIGGTVLIRGKMEESVWFCPRRKL